jgi:hypothetical protein
MRSISLLIIFYNLSSFALEQPEKEILKFFKQTPECSEFSIDSGFRISNLNGDLSSSNLLNIVKTPKTKDKTSPPKTCVSLPKGYLANIVEKDICYAFIVVHPQSLDAEQAKYLMSQIHRPPFQLAKDVVEPNFNPNINPFDGFRTEWNELGKLRNSENTQMAFSKTWDNPQAKTIVQKYSKIFGSLVEKYLASVKLKRTEIEVIRYNYAGCH